MKIDLKLDNEFLSKNSILARIYNTTESNSYIIVNYDADYTCDDDTTVANYHSVILEYPSRKILSFAPPKTLDIKQEQDHNQFFNSPNIYASELVEGTFIHLFYDERICAWEIASKRAVGCKYSYYYIPEQRALSFREMFIEGLGYPANTHLNDIPFLECLCKTYSYSFVLQHPSNHIVLTIPKPKVYLVAVYEILDSSVTFISPTEYEGWTMFDVPNISFPKSYPMQDNTAMELIQTYASIHSPISSMGIMFINIETGQRVSIVNPTYSEVAEIRGNHTNLQYQYLCLRRIGKVMQFLNYFPQYKPHFFKYRDQYEQFITNVHQSYISYYVKKQGTFISPKYFPVIYEIHHSVFLPSVSQEKIIVRKSVVRDYILKMDPAKVLHLLHYNDLAYKNDI
jgi:hypothetical protein